MNLSEFNALIGQNSYVRCKGKKRIDTSIVDEAAASQHLENGGSIGWWVRSGYIIVDIDEGQEQALKIIKKLRLKTLISKTPKGLHLYFKSDKDFPQRVGMILPCGLKCDFRCANKGYVLLPFGQKNRAFNKVREISEMPFEFTPIIGRKDSLLGLKEGDGRNSTMFAHLMAYKNNGATDEQIEVMANLVNTYIFSEPMKDDELSRIVENTKKYDAVDGFLNPYVIYTEKGKPSAINGRAICDYFVNCGDMFVIGSDCYYYRDGVYSESDSLIRNTIKDMVVADNLIKHQSIMDVYRLITDDTRLQKTTDTINNNKNLINFKNGVWDIQKAELLPHDPKYLQTIQIPHEVGEYVPFKKTRLYQFFKLTKLQKADIMMILKYMAYCMTVDYGLKCFMVLTGPSNTGKSVLIRFVETLVGGVNVSSLSMHDLNMRFYPAQLYNKLVNSCADNKTLPLSSIENLKKITGGDNIMHEKKGKEPFFFVPFAKLIFSFNQLPLQLEEKSNAFYKRMRVLLMENELFLNNQYVDDLCSEESIQEVIPYLLRLLPLSEIPRSETSNECVEILRRESDSLHDFIENACNKDPTGYIPKEDFFLAYVEFCTKSGREPHKKHAAMRNIRTLGIKEARRVVNGVNKSVWLGLTLKKRGEYL